MFDDIKLYPRDEEYDNKGRFPHCLRAMAASFEARQEDGLREACEASVRVGIEFWRVRGVDPSPVQMWGYAGEVLRSLDARLGAASVLPWEDGYQEAVVVREETVATATEIMRSLIA